MDCTNRPRRSAPPDRVRQSEGQLRAELWEAMETARCDIDRQAWYSAMNALKDAAWRAEMLARKEAELGVDAR